MKCVTERAGADIELLKRVFAGLKESDKTLRGYCYASCNSGYFDFAGRFARESICCAQDHRGINCEGAERVSRFLTQASDCRRRAIWDCCSELETVNSRP